MADFFASFKILYDCPRIENLDLSVSRLCAAAIAVCPSIHYRHTVSGSQEEFCIWKHDRAIVRSPVQEKNPITVWVGRSDLPTSEEDAIVGADKEVFPTRVKAGNNLVGLRHLPRGQPAAEGVKNSGTED